ncbi:MAG TPA: ABC transporter permease [Patescibacteria group bacterium]
MVGHWRKNIFFSVANVLGLSVGLAASFLIYCYIDFEYSYDRFHAKADRIYRLVCDTRMVADSGSRITPSALTAAPMGHMLQASFPQIESVVRLFKGNLLIRRGTVKFQEKRTVVVDADFLKVFDFPLLAGDPATAFKTPQSVVLTTSAARKYFGTANPLGQTVYLGPNAWPTKVSGVLKDLPENSQIKADLFFTANFAPDSINWSQLNYLTYLLMKSGSDLRPLQKIPAIIRGDNTYTLSLEPLTSVHLHSGRPGGFESGNIDNLRLFSFIAVFILLIVTFNFANLATAQAVDRIRTIGTYKLLGASRRRLFGQLMGETLLLSLLAFLLASVTARLLLPVFNQLAGKAVSIGPFYDLHQLILLFAGSIFAGIAAGIYPALFLSRYPALTALRGSFQPGKSSFVLRRSMVIAQFTLAFILILGTLVIYRQLHYMRNADPGFTTSQVLVIDTRTDERATVFKQNIARLPAVLSAAFSSDIPGTEVNAIIPLKLEETGGRMIDIRWAGCSVDFNYFRTIDILMAAGRPFSRSLSTDTMQAVMVNETAAHSIGYAKASDIVGRRCIRNGLSARVIGVVRDFHTRSFREPIAPLVLWLQPQDHDEYLSIRLSTRNLAASLAGLTKSYAAAMPNRPFDYFFLDDYFARLYDSEAAFGRLFGIFAIFAIILSCVGMLGFTAYELSQRHKEIGIRKLLGASVPSILRLLFTDLLRPILLALLIGAPLAGMLMRSWLDHYAYRIHPGAGIFLYTGSVLLVIVLATIAYHATRSALLSPLRIIRKD